MCRVKLGKDIFIVGDAEFVNESLQFFTAEIFEEIGENHVSITIYHKDPPAVLEPILCEFGEAHLLDLFKVVDAVL